MISRCPNVRNSDSFAVLHTCDETHNHHKDIDLHRFSCTKCGQMFYYSATARDFFEKGIESPMLGLTLFNLIKNDGLIPSNYKKD